MLTTMEMVAKRLQIVARARKIIVVISSPGLIKRDLLLSTFALTFSVPTVTGSPSQFLATGFPSSKLISSSFLSPDVGWQLWAQIFSEKTQVTKKEINYNLVFKKKQKQTPSIYFSNSSCSFLSTFPQRLFHGRGRSVYGWLRQLAYPARLGWPPHLSVKWWFLFISGTRAQ